LIKTISGYFARKMHVFVNFVSIQLTAVTYVLRQQYFH